MKKDTTAPKDGEIKRYKGKPGIEGRWSKRYGCWTYQITYKWKPAPELAAELACMGVKWSTRPQEVVPRDKDGKFRLESACKLKAAREKEKRLPEWMPPLVQARLDVARKAARTEQRAPLLFEAARDRFVKAKNGTRTYADKGRNAKAAFARLERAFGGKHLDAITRQDIRQYYLDRCQNTGPFADWPRKVGVRMPQTEITFLSALYTFVEDEGHEVKNPCHRPRTRRKDSPLATYRPARKPFIATKETLRAIFAAELKDKRGRDVIRDEHRTFWKLVYYTAARPESETGRLLHGDVTFGKGGEWGTVTYRKTKTGGDRTVPLHPEVADDLRAHMPPEPRFDKAARAAWAKTPVFSTRGRDGRPRAWDRYTARKAWNNGVRKAVPEAAAMRVRDLRATAKTIMIDAGSPELTADKILGHANDVRGGYYVGSMAAMREALTTLTLDPEFTALFTAPQGRT